MPLGKITLKSVGHAKGEELEKEVEEYAATVASNPLMTKPVIKAMLIELGVKFHDFAQAETLREILKNALVGSTYKNIDEIYERKAARAPPKSMRQRIGDGALGGGALGVGALILSSRALTKSVEILGAIKEKAGGFDVGGMIPSFDVGGKLASAVAEGTQYLGPAGRGAAIIADLIADNGGRGAAIIVGVLLALYGSGKLYQAFGQMFGGGHTEAEVKALIKLAQGKAPEPALTSEEYKFFKAACENEDEEACGENEDCIWHDEECRVAPHLYKRKSEKEKSVADAQFLKDREHCMRVPLDRCNYDDLCAPRRDRHGKEHCFPRTTPSRYADRLEKMGMREFAEIARHYATPARGIATPSPARGIATPSPARGIATPSPARVSSARSGTRKTEHRSPHRGSGSRRPSTSGMRSDMRSDMRTDGRSRRRSGSADRGHHRSSSGDRASLRRGSQDRMSLRRHDPDEMYGKDLD